jgi:hypothetical protein
MRRTLAIAAVALFLMPQLAIAGERPADAALGAVSGAVVFGPIGLVAGAIVGYTAGPSISRGLRRAEPHQGHRASSDEARTAMGDAQPGVKQSAPQAPSPAAVAAVSPPTPPPAPRISTAAPPVQPLE